MRLIKDLELGASEMRGLLTSSHLPSQVKDVPQGLAHSIRDRNLSSSLFRNSSDILRFTQCLVLCTHNLREEEGDEFSLDTPPSNLMYLQVSLTDSIKNTPTGCLVANFCSCWCDSLLLQ